MLTRIKHYPTDMTVSSVDECVKEMWHLWFRSGLVQGARHYLANVDLVSIKSPRKYLHKVLIQSRYFRFKKRIQYWQKVCKIMVREEMKICACGFGHYRRKWVKALMLCPTYNGADLPYWDWTKWTPLFRHTFRTFFECSTGLLHGTRRGPSQYKDRLIYVWSFPC